MQQRQQNTTTHPLLFRLTLDGEPVESESPEVQLRKPAGSFASATGNVTEISDGLYQYEWAAGDLDTIGDLVVSIESDGADSMMGVVQVVPFDPLAPQAQPFARAIVSGDGHTQTRFMVTLPAGINIARGQRARFDAGSTLHALSPRIQSFDYDDDTTATITLHSADALPQAPVNGDVVILI